MAIWSSEIKELERLAPMKKTILVTMSLIVIIACNNVYAQMQWTPVTTSAEWQERFQHSSVVFKNKMWILGGENNGIQLNDVWYSSDGKYWKQASPKAVWSGRACFSSVVFKNKIWVIGGVYRKDGKFVYLNDVWYSNDGKNWIQATDAASWPKRYAPQVIVYHDKMWLMGGCPLFPSTHLNDVWYSVDGNTWNQAASSSDWAVRKSFSVLNFKNRMWLIGGDTTAYKFGTNDVWNSKGAIK
jgi:hypothetical protein